MSKTGEPKLDVKIVPKAEAFWLEVKETTIKDLERLEKQEKFLY